MTDIYQKLVQDHRETAKILSELDNIAESDPVRRDDLFAKLKQELLMHARAEDATFYNALRQHRESEGDAQHAKHEHDEVENMLRELSHLDRSTPEWAAKFRELKQNVEAHVDEEESQIFSEAQDIFDAQQAGEIGRSFDQQKAQLARQ
ncbi:hemerythrin domain-containing protein [Thiohalorhabdus sp. Cl-TMA]|uniref:Hemerythrin domain-containing protein n=1 Tax=Thiohalorhabdus methylotrophus TaxID=3242694 RepID=A0ABV4TX46_9GAMM